MCGVVHCLHRGFNWRQICAVYLQIDLSKIPLPTGPNPMNMELDDDLSASGRPGMSMLLSGGGRSDSGHNVEDEQGDGNKSSSPESDVSIGEEERKRKHKSKKRKRSVSSHSDDSSSSSSSEHEVEDRASKKHRGRKKSRHDRHRSKKHKSHKSSSRRSRSRSLEENRTPKKKGRKRKHEESDYSSDSSDRSKHDSQDSDSDDESKSLSYKKKILAAFELLKVQVPVQESKAPVAKFNAPKEKAGPVSFPLTDTTLHHFKESWKSIIGGDSWDMKEAAGPPLKSKKTKKYNSTNKKLNKWYHVEEKDLKKWPLGALSVDSDFTTLPSKPTSVNKSALDPVMDSLGSVIKVLNQVTFMTKASVEIMKPLSEFIHEDGIEGWKWLTDFFDINSESVSHALRLSTHLMNTLVLEKRKEALAKVTGLNSNQSDMLKFVSPENHDDNLFSGQIAVFQELNDKNLARSAFQALSTSGSYGNKPGPSGVKRPFPERTFGQRGQRSDTRFKDRKGQGRGRGSDFGRGKRPFQSDRSEWWKRKGASKDKSGDKQ